MILKLAGRAAYVVAMSLMSVPAWADVMEIDGDGARWIAGGPVAVPVTDPYQSQGFAADSSSFPDAGLAGGEMPADLVIPQEAVADTARHLGYIPAQYLAKVDELSVRFDLSPALIEALVWQESRWRPNAVSPVGARGLAQLMPGTARELGVNPHDPFENLEGGARYLRAQLDRFDGDLEKALAAYNAGPGRVIRANGIPNIRETKQYVAAIMGRLSNYSRSIY